MVTARRYPHMITIQPRLTAPGTLTLTSPGLGEVRVDSVTVDITGPSSGLLVDRQFMVADSKVMQVLVTRKILSKAPPLKSQ